VRSALVPRRGFHTIMMVTDDDKRDDGATIYAALRLSSEEYDRLRALAKKLGRPMSKLVLEGVAMVIEKHRKKAK
jgi:hypothetical protein